MRVCMCVCVRVCGVCKCVRVCVWCDLFMYVCGAKLGLNKSEIRSVVALYILYKAHYLVHKAIE